MSDLSVKYLGLSLKSPIIAASCGMTSNFENVSKMENSGVGAIVVKSLFEEQISNEVNFVSSLGDSYPEMNDYLNGYIRQNSIKNYLDSLRKIRFAVSVPVIASINCYNIGEWISYAKEIENVGVDALEINLFDLPTTTNNTGADLEKSYIEVVRQVINSVKIPVAVKISSHFTNIPSFADSLVAQGAKGIVIFNRFFTPDIDLDTLKIVPAPILSQPTDYLANLRWTAILSSSVKGADISCTTGIHTPESAVKHLLAGASTVQLCSVIYKEGFGVISKFNDFLKLFMDKNRFDSIDSFIGKLNYSNIEDPLIFERAQFLKSFGGYNIKYN